MDLITLFSYTTILLFKELFTSLEPKILEGEIIHARIPPQIDNKYVHYIYYYHSIKENFLWNEMLLKMKKISC